MYNTEELQHIRRIMSEKLAPKRFEHTLGVSYTAAALAMAHGADISSAQMAGLLHDCAKRFPENVLIKKCEDHGIKLSEDELLSPAVIHAIYGAYLTEHKYGIADRDVVNAVRYHTTGRAGMSKLEKIVYIADYIEPTRDLSKQLQKLRSLAFKDLDETMSAMLDSTIGYLDLKKRHVAVDTYKALEYFKGLRQA